MDTEQKETKLAELQSSVNSLVDSNLYQAKLIQAMHKILIDAGIECGSKEIVAGMRYIESLKQQLAVLLEALNRLEISANDSLGMKFGTLSASFVKDIVSEALGKAVNND